jgi:hypothetical protein
VAHNLLLTVTNPHTAFSLRGAADFWWRIAAISLRSRGGSLCMISNS